MRNIEEMLTDLQGLHSKLNKSYETLQLQYSTAKQELETLRRGYSKHESVSPTRTSHSGVREWEQSCVKTSDPMCFDISALSYDRQEEGPEGIKELASSAQFFNWTP
jgi:AP-1-like factor